ncbi:MAG: glycosyltransferase family 4 protein [Flavobacteriales bacterium]
MRILLLTDGITPFVTGGMQRHSFYLAKFLQQLGHHITLVHCVPFDKKIPTNREVIQALDLPQEYSNIEIIGFKFPQPGIFPGHYLKESYIYSKLVYEHLSESLDKFDFIYAKGFSAWHFLHLKSKGQINRPKIGVNFHGLEMFQPAIGWKQKFRASLLRGAVKWNLQNADTVFSYGGKISSIIKNQGVDESKIIEIPTGIASDKIRSISESGKHGVRRFVFLGRYERRKGIEELNEVIKQTVPRDSVSYLFIGAIPHSKRLKRDDVEYTGELKDVTEIISRIDSCDVLISPSHSEGMPNVIMEAMARGLGVIATDVGAVSLMVDTDNGWLVKPGDISALKKALTEAADMDFKSLNDKGVASLRKVESKYKWELIAQQTADSLVRAVTNS